MRYDGGDVFLHTLRLAAGDDALPFLERLLSPDERARARAFRFERLARDFTITRAALRIVLSRYAGCEPAVLPLAYAPSGKPRIPLPGAPHFNLAHSGDVAVIAVMHGGEVGVDIERIRRFDELASVAARFFCAEEMLALGAVPDAARELAFFRCWTRKEAYLKAIGDGLTAPLDRVRVSLDPGPGARFLALGDDRAAAERWALHDIAPAPGYAGALAYEGPARALRSLPPCDAGRLLEMH